MVCGVWRCDGGGGGGGAVWRAGGDGVEIVWCGVAWCGVVVRYDVM